MRNRHKISRLYASLFSALTFLAFAPAAHAEGSGIQIVGGTEATPYSFPFIVAILSKGEGSRYDRQFCGGTLIHKKWVLTAAHCMPNRIASEIEVGILLHDLSSSSEGEIIDVAQIISHPEYDSVTMNNDMALLELSQEVTRGWIADPATGATQYVGADATAIGWGTLASEGSSPTNLQQVTLPIVSNDECNIGYAGGITDNMLCAGLSSGGKDTCQGDSGGPLFIESNSSYTLVGVTSFGEGCGSAGRYGVYARVSRYTSWINTYVPTGGGIGSEPTVTGGYGLWNGFLGMINIVELVNRSSSAVSATLNLYRANGTFAKSVTLSVGAEQQYDVILNDLFGFQVNTYGLVQVSNNISGRLFYYRPIGSGFSDFDFGFGVALGSPLTGDSFVGFNTFDPDSLGHSVANWLSIVNLSSATKSFTLTKFDMLGTVLSSESVSIGADQRLDVDGGHVNPGPSNVGLIRVSPTDVTSPYLAQLMRYGNDASGGYKFAFPLIAQASTSTTIGVPLGDPDANLNWLELINTSASSHLAQVSYYSEGGTLLQTSTAQLPAFGQVHVDARAIVGPSAIGQAIITPATGQGIAAQSMMYFRDGSRGIISTMFGSQARTARSTTLTGSYNLFLDMDSTLRISNATASLISLDLTLRSSSSAGSNRTVLLSAFSSTALNLGDSGFGTVANSYGTVILVPSTGGSVVAEVLRRRVGSDSAYQFIAPTGFD